MQQVNRNKSSFPVAAALLGLAVSACSAEPAEGPGAAIYRMQCAECHGSTGEGVPGEYDEALYGDRSVDSLARLIERTMPEEDPKLCVGEDARKVAAFIHEAFYSPAAMQRIGRTIEERIDLARLTGPQHRNTLADLLGSFERDREVPTEHGGLNGEYFNSKGMNKKEGNAKVRYDPRLEFDFGEGGPIEGIGAEQYSVVWEGSFLARESGFYEFRTSTPNGVRLYLNVPIRGGDRNRRDDSSGGRTATIDDWVSSGAEERQSTTRVYLLGGRHYPFRLDYFKYKEKRGAVRLEWKPPHGSWEVMSGDGLSPQVVGPTFVVGTPFPADDRSQGYERGTSVSREWLDAVTRSALATANEVDARLRSLSGAADDDPERAAKIKEFAARFVRAAFRRPLTGAERVQFVDAQFDSTDDPDIAMKRSVIRALESPAFLYPELRRGDGPPDAYAIASRLSYALWDSVPDEELLRAAKEGGLAETTAVAAQARRMLDDPRARDKMHAFTVQWLNMEERDLSKDRAEFPAFDEAVISDLRRSLLQFVDQVIWEEGSDYRQLLRADYLLLNQRLAELYGGEVEGEGYQRVPVDPGQRAGVLTHPYLLSALAYHDGTSPIHRGVFLTRNVVGRALKPPPQAVAFKDEEFDPKLSMREKVTRLTSDSACMACHSVINPLGFSLEHFDAVGRWRERDGDRPIDSRSEYTTVGGKTITVASARDIAEHAADSPQAHAAFVTALFHHLAKQSPAAYGRRSLGKLRESFAANDFDIRALMVDITTLHAVHSAETKERK